MNKWILTYVLAFAAAITVTAEAVDYPTYKPSTPQYSTPVYSTAEAAQGNTQGASFNSTSSYSKQLDEHAAQRTLNPYDVSGVQVNRSYSVPVAAQAIEGGVTTLDVANPGPHRIGHRPGGGADPVEPDPSPDMPIGDTPWLIMMLLALGYIVTRVYRSRNSGIQE